MEGRSVKHLVLILLLAALALLPACQGSNSSGGDDDSDTGADSDTDSDSDTNTDTGSACEDLPIAECEVDDTCVLIRARWVNLADECLGEMEPVGCRLEDTDCGEAITLARDPDDECWMFTNTCLPSGWEEASAGDPCQEAGSWSTCG